MDNELITAVKQMRYLQKQYFKTRDYRILMDSKAAERAVDEMIERLTKPKTPELF